MHNRVTQLSCNFAHWKVHICSVAAYWSHACQHSIISPSESHFSVLYVYISLHETHQHVELLWACVDRITYSADDTNTGMVIVPLVGRSD